MLDKHMIVLHDATYIDGYDKCLVDVSSITFVGRSSSRNCSFIRYNTGNDFVNLEVKESISEISDKLSAAGVKLIDQED